MRVILNATWNSRSSLWDFDGNLKRQFDLSAESPESATGLSLISRINACLLTARALIKDNW
jgi:hypothetical protein